MNSVEEMLTTHTADSPRISPVSLDNKGQLTLECFIFTILYAFYFN